MAKFGIYALDNVQEGRWIPAEKTLAPKIFTERCGSAWFKMTQGIPNWSFALETLIAYEIGTRLFQNVKFSANSVLEFNPTRNGTFMLRCIIFFVTGLKDCKLGSAV